VPHVRWVDDLVMFAPDARTASRVEDRVRSTLEGIGLEANERKSRRFPPRSVTVDPNGRGARVDPGVGTCSGAAP